MRYLPPKGTAGFATLLVLKEYVEVFNSDAKIYGGTGAVNEQPCKVAWIPSHGQRRLPCPPARSIAIHSFFMCA